MIADFEQPLQTHGPWLYRRLFWETGMIGQVLYLEAEACLPETPRVWGGRDRYPDPAVASIVHEALANFGNAHTALDMAEHVGRSSHDFQHRLIRERRRGGP